MFIKKIRDLVSDIYIGTTITEWEIEEIHNEHATQPLLDMRSLFADHTTVTSYQSNQ